MAAEKIESVGTYRGTIEDATLDFTKNGYP